MISELTHPWTGAVPDDGFDRFGHLAVSPCQAGRALVLVKGVFYQRVREAVAAGPVGDLAHECRCCGGIEHIE